MTILVSGLINHEITLQVEHFPVEYEPVRYPFFGISSSVSGVGYNISKALTALGDDVTFLSLIGKDPAGTLVRHALTREHIDDTYVIDPLEQTPHSVILYDRDGRRAIHVDLKDIQEQPYPPDLVTPLLKEASLAVLCNINFSRPLLLRARLAGARVATDVHSISNLDDEYNHDFMVAADILFMSHERLPTSPEDFARAVQNRYGVEIIVIGLGAEGALLAVRGDAFMERFPAVTTRPVVNTIGAGDALFSAFVHHYNKHGSPVDALRSAIVFASYKIGAAGAAGLDALCQQVYS